MMGKTIIQNLTFDAYIQAIRKGHRLRLKTQGRSMLPFLTAKDKIAVVHCDAWQVKPGNIIIFRLNDNVNKIVAHRLIRRVKNKDGYVFITKGDSRFYCDKAIEPGSVLGRVVTIEKPNFNIELETMIGGALNFIMHWLSMSRVFSLWPILREKARKIRRYLT